MQESTQNKGRRGEQLASAYLCALGHAIVARNWRKGHLEIDIVSVADGNIHFVEVKSRSLPCYVDPLVNITPSKMRHLISAAKCFMASSDRKRIPVTDPEIVFDVITVEFDKGGNATVRYYPEAFSPLTLANR